MHGNVERFKKLIWLAEVIYSTGGITRKQIDERWLDSSVNDAKEREINDRTFFRWINEAEELLDIEIKCNKSSKQYYIANASELSKNKAYQWLMNSYTMSELLHENSTLTDRILLEDVPSEAHYLSTIVEAMKTKHRLEMEYCKFESHTPHTFTLAPYCVKMFRQRWYVIGMSSDHPDEVRVYALDRVKRLILTEDRYKMPRGFNAKACFRDYYGIYNGPEKPERIVLRVTARGANYLRTLPLHTSQREKEKTDEYSVFEYRVAPTKDLIRELQAYGTELQVLEPQSLVEQFRVLAKEYARMYTMNDNINIEQV